MEGVRECWRLGVDVREVTCTHAPERPQHPLHVRIHDFNVLVQCFDGALEFCDATLEFCEPLLILGANILNIDDPVNNALGLCWTIVTVSSPNLYFSFSSFSFKILATCT